MGETIKYGVNNLPVHGDQNGKLVAIEEMVSLPFEICRVFTIYGSAPGVVRGNHANRKSSFAFICLSGSCDVTLFGPGRDVSHKERLDSPDKLFWIGPMVWKAMTGFSADCILTVLSDHVYDPDEYIYDFNEYEQLLRG